MTGFELGEVVTLGELTDVKLVTPVEATDVTGTLAELTDIKVVTLEELTDGKFVTPVEVTDVTGTLGELTDIKLVTL